MRTWLVLLLLTVVAGQAQAQLYPSSIDNTATVTVPTDASDPDGANNTSTDSNTLAAVSDLAMDKALLTTGPYLVGQTVQYRLTIRNLGPSAAENVQITDTPTNLTILQVTGACTALPCTIPTLAPDATATIDVTARIDAAGAFDNSATTTSPNTDPNPGDNTDSDGGTATAPVASISVAPASVLEDGATNLVYTVTLSVAPAVDTVINLAISGTATSGSDYTGAVTSVTIPAGSTSATFTLDPTADTVVEPDETAIATITAGTGYDISAGNGSATGTITNDDVPQVSIDSVSTNEGDAAVFTVSLSAASASDVTVTLNTVDGSAVAPGDYTAQTAITVTIPAGRTSVTVSVPTIEDALYEGDETFTAVLSNPVGASLGTATGTGTIVDDEAVPVVDISGGGAVEGNPVQFTVSLSGASASDVTVTLNTADGSAVAPGDYTAQTAIAVTIPAGSTSATVSVPTIDDALFEGDETFTATIGNPVGATLGTATATGTISENDASPTLSINDISVNENAGTATFTVALSGASAAAVTVDYASTNGTATAGLDYTAVGGSLSFAPGVLTQTVTVPILDDNLDEPDETFTIALSNAVGATIADGSGLGTIVDDDAAPTVSIAGASATEGSPVQFTVSLSNPSASDVTVTLNTADGSAVAPGDYTAQTALTVTIPAGGTSVTVNAPTVDDALFEGNETFTATIANPVGATLGTATATGTIVDDEAAPTLSINDVTVNESAGTATFTVTLSTASGATTTVDYATSNGTATAPSDYTAAAGTLSIAAGVLTQTITVPIVDDNIDEANETFTVTLSNGAGASIADGSGQGTITDDDAAPVISIAGASAAEGSPVQFVVSLSAPSASDVTVTLNTSDGSAVAPGDYAAQSGVTVTIPAGSTSVTVDVPTVDDAVFEGDETFTATISNPVGATLGTATATGTITENDAAPTVSIDSVTVTEGSPAVFTVSLSAPSASDVTVTLNTGDGSATAPADYVAQSGLTVTIPAGATSATVNVPTLDDALFEGNETFTATIGNPVGATLGTATGTGTITDNDAAPVLTIADAPAVTEGGNLVYVLTLTTASASDITVPLSYAGTATPGSDYSGNVATLTIATGATTATLTLPTSNDGVFEGSEIATVTLGAGSGYTLGAQSVGSGTINDAQAAPVVTIGDASAITEGGTLVYPLTLSTPSATDTVISFTLGGSASAGADYTAPGVLTVTIPAGSTSATLSLPTLNDGVFEGSETVTVQLQPGSGYTLGSPATGTGTINDAQSAPTIAIADGNANEGNPVPLVITLSGPSATDVTVTLTTSDGSATAPVDYTAQAGITVTIPAGTTTVTVPVSTVGDTLFEGNETFNATLGNPNGATLGDAAAIATINDDDAAPVVTIGNAPTITEGGTLVYPLTLSSPTAVDTVISFTLGGSASAGADYIAPGTLTVTIPAGSTNATLSLPTLNDGVFEGSETVTVQLQPGSGYTLGSPATGNGTINDAQSQIVAAPDSGSVGGAAGGTAVVNVLGNDSIGGATATPATVVLSQVATSNPNISLDTATGAVNVAPGTPAGSYTLTYQICEIGSPGNCATATVTVTVTPAAVDAVDDVGAADGTTGGQAVANVLGNDSVDGSAVAPSAVIVSQVSSSTPGLSLDTATGAINVAPGTLPGAHTLVYRLCEALNPDNCDTATVTVTVTGVRALPPVVANDDTATTPQNTPVTTPVLGNDTVGGNPVDPTTVVVTIATPPAHGSVTVNPDGSITYTPGSNFSGTDSYVYRVCEVANPSNCATATVTVTAQPNSVQAVDDHTETHSPVTIDVLANDTVSGAPLDPSTLTIVDTPDHGTVSCTAGTCTYTPDNGYSGNDSFAYRICDRSTPTPVCDNATVQIAVSAIAAQLRLVKQAGQRTARPGDLVRYTVIAENVGEVPATNASFIDTPPAGFTYVDGSLAVDDEDDNAHISGTDPLRIDGIDVAVGGRATLVYYLRVGAGVGHGVFRNRVSGVDEQGRSISNEASAEVEISGDPLLDDSLILGSVFDDRDGDGWQDPAAAKAVRVQGGFAPEAYVPNSTTVDRGDGPQPEPDASAPLLHGIALGTLHGRGSSADPVEAHEVVIRQKLRSLDFRDDFVLSTGEGTTLRMSATGDTRVERGRGDAGKGLNGEDLEVDRQVSRVADGYEVAYVIRNRGIEERGIPGVRIASVEGLIMETDAYGRFHLVGIPGGDLARGRNFILKVDPATLPPGSVFTSENPRVRRITAGVPTRFDFGVTLPAGDIEAGTQTTEIELGTVLFAPGSAEVKADYEPLFTDIANKLTLAGGGSVSITAAAEQEPLAYARAQAVQAALAKRLPGELAPRVQVTVAAEVAPDQPLLRVGQTLTLGTLLFDTDQASVRPQYRGLIHEIAANLARQGGGTVAVVGHADQRGSDAHNLELGLRRARSVFEAISAELPDEARRRLRVDITDDPDAVGVGER